MLTSSYSKAIYCLLQAVVDLTKICFKAELAACIQVLLKVDVVVKVVAVLKLSLAIVL